MWQGVPSRLSKRTVRALNRFMKGLVAGALISSAVATPASAEGPPAPTSLRFVTLNVFHGGPLSGWTGRNNHLETRLDLVAEALRDLSPDVVALQEASWSRDRGEVAARLAERLGFNYVYTPSSMRLFETAWFNRAAAWLMDFAEGPALLSRFPVVSSEAYKLPQCGWRLDPRVLLLADLATPGGVLRVFSTHISGHHCQADALGELVSEHRGDIPSVLMGDFNAVESSPAIRGLLARSGVIDAFRTAHPDGPGFTVYQPVMATERRASRRIDYVFLVPGRTFPGGVVDSRVVIDSPVRLGRGRTLWPSDHYGVLADLIVFPPSTGTAGRVDVRWARAPEPQYSKAP
jgi:endonuclease/exonuclease/phosphatase family metal-dependent hydrolase